MYKWATPYNIPWMLMFVSCAQNCFGKMVKKDSPIYMLLQKVNNVQLEQYYDSDWYIVKNHGEFLILYFSLIAHKRKVVNDEVIETFELRLSTKDNNGLPQKVNSALIEISECRFPNLVNSKEAKKYRQTTRNQELLRIARMLMPEL